MALTAAVPALIVIAIGVVLVISVLVSRSMRG